MPSERDHSCRVGGCRSLRLPYSPFCREHHNEFSNGRQKVYRKEYQVVKQHMARLLQTARTLYGPELELDRAVDLAIEGLKVMFKNTENNNTENLK